MTSLHSVRVDRLIQPMDICRSAAKAVDELIEAIGCDDVHGIIAAERRLVAVGALAQTNANRLEAQT